MLILTVNTFAGSPPPDTATPTRTCHLTACHTPTPCLSPIINSCPYVSAASAPLQFLHRAYYLQRRAGRQAAARILSTSCLMYVCCMPPCCTARPLTFSATTRTTTTTTSWKTGIEKNYAANAKRKIMKIFCVTRFLLTLICCSSCCAFFFSFFVV